MRTLSLALAATLFSGCSSSSNDACDPDATGTICTIAGTGESRNAPDVIDALEATLDEPQDVMVAPDGTLWITDFNYYKLRALGTDGKVRRIMGSIFGDSPRSESAAATPSLQAKFNHFPTITLHDNAVYIAAWHNRDIKKLDLATMLVTDVAGTSIGEQYTGDGGPALSASIDLPSGIAFDPQGRLVWMDQANQVIRRINTDGNVERIAGVCIAGEDVHPCAADETPQPCPNSDKLFCGGDVLACDEFCTPGFAGDGGPALDARLAQAFGQRTDPGGRLTYAGDVLYFADRDNNRIRKIDANGIITTIAGTGDIGYGGDGGPAVDAMLDRPIDLEVAADGTLYFTDTGNNCVRKIDPAGMISTVAGVCTPTYAPATGGFGGDGGPATDALLNWPYGLALDGNKLYIADSYNNRVRVVNL
jgi:sugar lactone lactonase YvrE